MVEKPNILIAVPSYRGNIKSGCALSLMRLSHALCQRAVSFTAFFPDINDITQSRNLFASIVEAEATPFTHLFFCDDDMIFNPSAMLRMLDSGADVIGCPYPLRKGANRSDGPTSFVVQFDSVGAVTHVGTGLMLISARALRRMRESGKLRCQTQHSFDMVKYDGPIYGFFDRVAQPNTWLLPEDFSFCLRWRSLCAGTIHIVEGEDVGHVGEIVWSGSFSTPPTAQSKASAGRK